MGNKYPCLIYSPRFSEQEHMLIEDFALHGE
jgi:hypothetical protein